MSCTKGGVTSAYTYGADGLRRSSTVGGLTTYYAYDGQTLIQEMQSAQGVPLHLTATYLQGPRGSECRIDEMQQTEGYYRFDANGNVIKNAQGQPIVYGRGVTKWYVYDGLGSVVGEVDINGNLTSSPKYDVYGAVRSNPGTASSRQGFVGGLGHVSDTETGLIYMRARYYDLSVGRFESEDPGGSGNNWFLYCDDNPVNKVDATGKDAFDDAAAILKILYDNIASANGLGFPGNTPPGNLAAMLRYLDARIAQLLGRGVTETGEGAVEMKKGQSEDDADQGAQEIEGGSTVEDGASKVAEAEELRSIADFISEGCPNDDGF